MDYRILPEKILKNKQKPTHPIDKFMQLDKVLNADLLTMCLHTNWCSHYVFSEM